jgi:hypothetical protein
MRRSATRKRLATLCFSATPRDAANERNAPRSRLDSAIVYARLDWA